jgi:hypothetical protein
MFGMLYVASWSRSPDPIGRIWRALFLALVAVLLRWQERRPGRTMRGGIYFNKVVFRILRRLVTLVLIRSSRRPPAFYFTKLSWWE